MKKQLIKLSLFFIFYSNNLLIAQNCNLSTNKYIGNTLLDSVFNYSDLKMNKIADEFRKTKENINYQLLFYRNNGIETLTYLEVSEENVLVANSRDFRVLIDNYNLKTKTLKMELNKIELDFKVYEQTCPEKYYPIGDNVIEQIWIKKNGKLSYIYFGKNGPLDIVNNDNKNIKELKSIMQIIFFNWRTEWGNGSE